MKRLVGDPRFHVAWLVLLVAALFAAYVTDPYVFGFAVLASSLLAVAAVLSAMSILSGFKWA